MKAEILKMSWIDRKDQDLPPGVAEFTFSVQVKHGSGEYMSLMNALRNKPEGRQLSTVEVAIGG